LPGRQEVSGSTPLFSTRTHKTPDAEHFTNVSGVYSVKTQPQKLPKKSRKNVVGRNSMFSTGTRNSFDNQVIAEFSGSRSAKIQPHYLSLEYMAIPELPYTVPRLVKGKRIESVPKGSSFAKEEALQNWYIEFFFHNAETGQMDRFRPTKNLNRIKDPREKLKHFSNLCEAYKVALEGGWNPIDDKANDKLKKEIISITLEQAKIMFEEYHIAKGTRKKSIQSYLSKVTQFMRYHGAGKKINQITDYEVTTFLNHMEKEGRWVGATYNNSRIALYNYFKYLKKNKYLSINPVEDTETRTILATESHQVFSDKDFKTIMNWLEANDPYCLLFVRTIYYTCIRPKELRYLKLKYIDLKKNIITIPATVAKNKKALPVNIDRSLRSELDKLNLSQYPNEYFLFGSVITIVGENRTGENTPYNRFQKCLRETKLLGKNYTLYSFKHFSNVQKFKAGWTLAEICSANRHSSLVETETYLKDLLKFVQTKKVIPKI